MYQYFIPFYIILFYLLGNPHVKYYFRFRDEDTEAQKGHIYKVLEPRSSRARTQTPVSYKFLVLSSTSGCQLCSYYIRIAWVLQDPRGSPNERRRPSEGTVNLYFNRYLVWSWGAAGGWPGAGSWLTKYPLPSRPCAEYCKGDTGSLLTKLLRR